MICATSYILETDRSLPRLVHFPKLGRIFLVRWLLVAVPLFGFVSFLNGLGKAIENVDGLVGGIFLRVGAMTFLLLVYVQVRRIRNLPDNEYPFFKELREELLDIETKTANLDSIAPDKRDAARDDLTARRQVVLQKLDDAHSRFAGSSHLVWMPKTLK